MLGGDVVRTVEDAHEEKTIVERSLEYGSRRVGHPCACACAQVLRGVVYFLAGLVCYTTHKGSESLFLLLHSLKIEEMHNAELGGLIDYGGMYVSLSLP